MRKCVFIVLINMVLSVANVSGQSEWKRNLFLTNDFYIDFIQEPQYVVDSFLLQDDLHYTCNWTLDVEDPKHPNRFYSISVTKYHPAYISSDSSFSIIEGFINSTQTSMFEDSTFALIYSSLIGVNGYLGKSFQWENKISGLFLKYEIFLVNSTIYQLAVVTKEGQDHNVFIDKFFDSFRLMNVPRGKFVMPEN